MAKNYTTAQSVTINDAWYAVQRMVESSGKMERRLALCEKEMKRHFPPTAARSHALAHVHRGMCVGLNPDRVTEDLQELMIRAGDDDDQILAMTIGMHYAGHENADQVREALASAGRAEVDAQTAFLATL